ncbi:hypothetical protein PUN28_009559 [Cardiocondyla obscurior]|uniref:Uncharacterized protein n=1 Tax=Cardiocondyla obscurior TaxID=286306 RepID=A0AAW2FYF5_9HYME
MYYYYYYTYTYIYLYIRQIDDRFIVSRRTGSATNIEIRTTKRYRRCQNIRDDKNILNLYCTPYVNFFPEPPALPTAPPPPTAIYSSQTQPFYLHESQMRASFANRYAYLVKRNVERISKDY